MLFREFSVVRFHNVLDSGGIPVENDVTCLLGKNEAGKTALPSGTFALVMTIPCAGLVEAFMEMTIRIPGGNVIVFVPAGRSIGYANRYE